MQPTPTANLTCPHCGHEHQAIALAPGTRAHCVRCDSVLASGSRFGPDAALSFALAGLVLAGPALLLPFVSAGKMGTTRIGSLFVGVEGLWEQGMPLLAVWVCLSGILVPVALLASLGLLQWPSAGRPHPLASPLGSAAQALAHWSMPEVQVLAVLVALIKLDALVDVTIGAGFWCYGGMSLCLLLAWRSFELAPSGRASVEAEPLSAGP